MAGILDEFKEFINKGNVLDLAVGFIMGVAFKDVVKSLVNDVIMPPIGLLLGGVDFSNLKLVLSTTAEGEVAIRYGQFINVVVEFLIIAFAVFMIVKVANKLKKKEEPKAPEPPKESEEVKLLKEIRDALVKSKKTTKKASK